MMPEKQMSASQPLVFFDCLAHESVLRTPHPASQDIRSLVMPEKQMSASQPLVFLWHHYILHHFTPIANRIMRNGRFNTFAKLTILCTK